MRGHHAGQPVVGVPLVVPDVCLSGRALPPLRPDPTVLVVPVPGITGAIDARHVVLALAAGAEPVRQAGIEEVAGRVIRITLEPAAVSLDRQDSADRVDAEPAGPGEPVGDRADQP